MTANAVAHKLGKKMTPLPLSRTLTLTLPLAPTETLPLPLAL